MEINTAVRIIRNHIFDYLREMRGGRNAGRTGLIEAANTIYDYTNEKEKYRRHDLRKNPEDLPPVETEVEVVCDSGHRIIITHGIYEDGSKHTEESEWLWNDIDCYGTYCEETDDYIIPEGWWEYRHYNCDECYNNVIDDKIIAWRYIEPFEEV